MRCINLRFTYLLIVSVYLIICLCRSLPSWQNLKPPASSHGQFDEDLLEPQMSDDELYLMNSKESSVLTSNLLTTESSEPQLEIISDPANLRALCNLCESMVRLIVFWTTIMFGVESWSFTVHVLTTKALQADRGWQDKTRTTR